LFSTKASLICPSPQFPKPTPGETATLDLGKESLKIS